MPAGQSVARTALRGLRSAGYLQGFRLPLDALTLEPRLLSPLLGLWSRIHWSSGDGMMPGDQLLPIYRLAAKWDVPGDIVELGSWRGLTTCYLAAAAGLRGASHVYAVDTFCGTKEGGVAYSGIDRLGGETLTDLRRRTTQARVAERVTPLVGLTTTMSKFYPGRPISVLLIDADHSYDGVRSDFHAWRRHMAPGGLMIFHDYEMPSVSRFVDELVTSERGLEPSPGRIHSNVFGMTVVETMADCDQVRDVTAGVKESSDEPVLAASE